MFPMVMNNLVYLVMTMKAIKLENECHECFRRTIFWLRIFLKFDNNILCLEQALIFLYYCQDTIKKIRSTTL